MHTQQLWTVTEAKQRLYLKMSWGVTDNEEDQEPIHQDAHINLHVTDQDGHKVIFRTKRSTPLKKLMSVYCDRKSVDFDSFSFLFKGRFLRPEKTPDDMQMEDGDEIDALYGLGAHITLKVKGQDGNKVFLKTKRSTPLKKLMNSYCDQQSVDLNSISFLFEGRCLQAEQTADELEMKDGDEIEAIFYYRSAYVNLKVKGQDGREVFFNIKRSTQLRRLMDVYCYRQCLDLDGVHFLFEDCLLSAEQTPHELDMVDGDVIEAVLHQRCFTCYHHGIGF